MRNLFLAQMVSKMWMTLNPTVIKELLSNDAEYITDLALMSIKGKENVLDFFSKKLHYFHTEVNEGRMGLYSNVVTLQGNNDEAFVELFYSINGVADSVLMRVSEFDGLISSLSFFKNDEIPTMQIL